MSDRPDIRGIFQRFGFDPDDPVPVDDEGDRVMPGRLLSALAHVNLEERPLTKAETRVIVCFSHGLSYRETADVLGLSVETIKTEAASGRRRLGAKTKAHACSRAIRLGLIP